jgi:hypothetical protein
MNNPDTLFVHFPPCSSRSFKEAWEKVIHDHPSMGWMRNRIDISNTMHAEAQLPAIAEYRSRASLWRYVSMWLLMYATKRTPMTYTAWLTFWTRQEDKVRARYQRTHAKSANMGVFVVTKSGGLTHDMWRNLTMLSRRNASVYVIKQIGEDWYAEPVHTPPPRNMRLGRKESMRTLGEYIDPKDGQGFSLAEMAKKYFGEQK